MLNHNGSIYVFNEDNCLLFEKGNLKHHSKNKKWFSGAITVSTDVGIFMFHAVAGSFEYLLNDQTTWKIVINAILKGFLFGSAIFVKSKREIWLIGGLGTEDSHF